MYFYYLQSKGYYTSASILSQQDIANTEGTEYYIDDSSGSIGLGV
jgi:hypothetical protein